MVFCSSFKFRKTVPIIFFLERVPMLSEQGGSINPKFFFQLIKSQLHYFLKVYLFLFFGKVSLVHPSAQYPDNKRKENTFSKNELSKKGLTFYNLNSI